MLKNKTPIFLSLDFETTGSNPDKDSIIEVGAFLFTYNSEGELIELDKISQLVFTEHEIPPIVSAITGISNEDLVGQPKLSSVLPKLEGLIEKCDYIVGHNIFFDLSFISPHIKIEKKYVDTIFLAETIYPFLSSYSLDVLYHELDLDRGHAHRALDDARLSAEILLRCFNTCFSLCRTNPNLNELAMVFRQANLPEGEIFSQVLLNIKQAKVWEYTKSVTYDPKPFVPISESIAQNLKKDSKKIIIHPPTSKAVNSFCGELNKYTKNNLIVALKDRADLNKINSATYLGDSSRQICTHRLKEVKRLKILSPTLARVTAKLLVAEVLDSNFSVWPRFSSEEKNFLPLLYVYPEICQKHNCPNYNKFADLKKDTRTGVLLHSDLVNLPTQYLPKKKLVVTDFDDAADSMQKQLEIKFNSNFWPNILSAIPQIHKSKKRTGHASNLALDLKISSNSLEGSQSIDVSNLVKKIITSNDDFWQNILHYYQDNLFIQNPFFITPAIMDEREFKNIQNLARKLSTLAKKLIKELSVITNELTQAHCASLVKNLSDWEKLIKRDNNYHLCLEGNTDKLTLKLSPSFNLVSEMFNQKLNEKTLLTAANSDDNLLQHYINILNLQAWPIDSIKESEKGVATLAVVASSDNTYETSHKLLIKESFSRAVIVAKNKTEGKAIAAHLSASLPNIRIFTTDNGTSKGIHQFTQSKEGVLIIPARGGAINLSWPEVDVAIICSIPFPAPEVGFTFANSTLPKAMLASKTLLSKILKHGNSNLKVFLIDQRLRKQTYGKNFISLAEILCGCKHNYLQI